MAARTDPGREGAGSSHSWRRVRTSDRMLRAGAAFAGAALAAAGPASLAAAGEGSGAFGVAGSVPSPAPAAHEVVGSAPCASAYVKVHNVQGRFSFSQDVVTPTERLVRDLGGTSSVLCPEDATDGGAAGIADAWGARLARAGTGEDALATTLEVGGLVRHPVRARLSDLAADGSLEGRLMAYTCADNPPDGRATANARVEGVDLVRVIDQARPDSSANVARLVSVDGYEVSVPLDYLLSHGAMVVCRVNGLPASQVVGATTQLWIGATAARYNVRDLARVVVEHVPDDRLPAAPGSAASGDGYTNRPNVGALGARGGAGSSSASPAAGTGFMA